MEKSIPMHYMPVKDTGPIPSLSVECDFLNGQSEKD